MVSSFALPVSVQHVLVAEHHDADTSDVAEGHDEPVDYGDQRSPKMVDVFDYPDYYYYSLEIYLFVSHQSDHTLFWHSSLRAPRKLQQSDHKEVHK